MALKVYYVDDEEFLCENFADGFASDEIQVCCFPDAKTALEGIKKSPPDILFLDYRMPETNGVEMAEQLNPQFPVVLITGEINIQTKFPFYKIITKPYTPEEVSAIFREIEAK